MYHYITKIVLSFARNIYVIGIIASGARELKARELAWALIDIIWDYRQSIVDYSKVTSNESSDDRKSDSGGIQIESPVNSISIIEFLPLSYSPERKQLPIFLKINKNYSRVILHTQIFPLVIVTLNPEIPKILTMSRDPCTLHPRSHVFFVPFSFRVDLIVRRTIMSHRSKRVNNKTRTFSI